MAKPKNPDKEAQICFKCSPALVESMKTLAHIQRRSVSDILVELCIGYINANRAEIIADWQKTAQAIARIKAPTYGDISAPDATPARADDAAPPTDDNA